MSSVADRVGREDPVQPGPLVRVVDAGPRGRLADRVMVASTLLKSWATPPASCPTACIFWAWVSWAAIRRSSVTSRATTPMPATGWSSWDRTG